VSAGLFQIVLVEPEIPNNTGNIGRTCVATGCGLHLIEPLGFDTSEKACRRAGLDYWPRLKPTAHASFDAYLASARPERLWLFSTKGVKQSVHHAEIRRGDHLVFGKETRGLDESLLSRFADRVVSLPMVPNERSLNLATAVCAAVYLGVDQMLRRGELSLDETGRLAPGTLGA
jgi:tRNA (cytidine/uridine-2'-O-)-methyltransferase